MKRAEIYLKNLRGKWTYECSVVSDKTLKQIKQSFCVRHALSENQVKAKYHKNEKNNR